MIDLILPVTQLGTKTIFSARRQLQYNSIKSVFQTFSIQNNTTWLNAYERELK